MLAEACVRSWAHIFVLKHNSSGTGCATPSIDTLGIDLLDGCHQHFCVSEQHWMGATSCCLVFVICVCGLVLLQAVRFLGAHASKNPNNSCVNFHIVLSDMSTDVVVSAQQPQDFCKRRGIVG